MMTRSRLAFSGSGHLHTLHPPPKNNQWVDTEPQEGDSAMPCAEITNAIAWSQKTTDAEAYPVHAYFTKHYGYDQPATEHKDAVFYASGPVYAVSGPPSHLKGSLKVAKNTEIAGQMSESSELTFDVEVFPDGTLTYLMRINGKPVGGLPATKLKANCVNNVLLSATNGSEIVTVGVARKIPVETPAIPK
jgi:hypothetical protein